MKVAIAGAGAVGRSIARELLANGHNVLLIDKNPVKITPERIPDAEWLLGDACEVENLETANLQEFAEQHRPPGQRIRLRARQHLLSHGRTPTFAHSALRPARILRRSRSCHPDCRAGPA